MIVAFYASLLGLIYVGLSFYVINGRFKHQVGLGDGGNDLLIRRIRSHGNFAEFIPMILILMILSQYLGLPENFLHAAGIATVLGRVLHVIGLKMTDGASKPRFVGMVLTFLTIIGLSVFLLVKSSALF